jgi:ABC-2 type transport system permease protein/lipopolysaccharide transport system permease protein
LHKGLQWRVERVAHAMTLPTPSEGEIPPHDGNLQAVDPSSVPAEPPSHLMYYHQAQLRASLRDLWASRDIIFTLAERDIRAQYKQATLGLLWALLAPLALLGIFTIIFSREKTLGIPGIPYPIFAYIGILCWTFFSQALGTGGPSMMTNNALLSKTQFPRECFPLETVLVTAVNTVLAWIPLVLLFILYGFVPRPTTVWVPLLILVELLFTIGVTLATSALIIQMRDLAQILPIVIQLGLFATPVIWQFKKIPPEWRIPYGFISPLGPVIDDARRTMLQGLNPVPGPLIAAMLGTAFYLFMGYRLFKRLEVNFADIA